jgi:uncharacterized membrane protein
MEQEQRRSIIKIVVYNHKHKLLSNAKVIVKPLKEADAGRRKFISMRFDETMKVYQANNVDPGRYIFRAELKGYEAQERVVTVGQSGSREIFILGTKGMSFFYSGKIKVPFEPLQGLLAL